MPAIEAEAGERANSATDVQMEIHMLWPVVLISCTFMPKIDEARLIGMKMKARTVTARCSR